MRKFNSLFLALLITLTSIFGTACEDDDSDTDEPSVAGEVVAGAESDCRSEDPDMGDEEEESDVDVAGEEMPAGEEPEDMMVAGDESEEETTEAGEEVVEEAPAGEESSEEAPSGEETEEEVPAGEESTEETPEAGETPDPG